MLSVLHREMAAFSTLGHWRDDRGWTAAYANIALPCTADSFLKASHVSRTGHVDQMLTACCPHILMQKFYTQNKEGLSDYDDDDIHTFHAWKATVISKHPQFQHW